LEMFSPSSTLRWKKGLEAYLLAEFPHQRVL
jgi:hypothetical protein